MFFAGKSSKFSEYRTKSKYNKRQLSPVMSIEQQVSISPERWKTGIPQSWKLNNRYRSILEIEQQVSLSPGNWTTGIAQSWKLNNRYPSVLEIELIYYGITFIMCAHNQKIGKSNMFKSLKAGKPKGLNNDSHNQLRPQPKGLSNDSHNHLRPQPKGLSNVSHKKLRPHMYMGGVNQRV